MVFILAQLPQHRVDQSRGPLAFMALRHLHRLTDSGAVRDPVHKKDLIGAQAQHVPDKGLQLLEALGTILSQVKIQKGHVLQHAVGKPGGKGRLPPVQAPHSGLQAAV